MTTTPVVFGPFLSKKLALHKGYKQFFEGKPCKRGHIDARQLANGRCMECQRQRKLELYYNPDLGKRKKAPITVKRRVSNRVSTLTAPDFKAIAEQGYFVYAWIRQRDLTPWYIGKACPRDAYRPHSKNHTYNPPSNRALIRILRSGLATEEEAHQWERAYIKRYKRRDIHPDGVLFNHTDGGEGTSGRIVDPETAKKIGEKAGKAHLEMNRAWEPLGITKERWESLSVSERAALRYFVMANPGTTGNDYFEGNYTKWQSSEAGLEHQQQAAAIGALNKKKAAAEKWGLSLNEYLSLDHKALSRMKTYVKRRGITATEWLEMERNGGPDPLAGNKAANVNKQRAAAARNGVAFEVWQSLKPWQRDNITAARKSGRDVQHLLARYSVHRLGA